MSKWKVVEEYKVRVQKSFRLTHCEEECETRDDRSREDQPESIKRQEEMATVQVQTKRKKGREKKARKNASGARKWRMRGRNMEEREQQMNFLISREDEVKHRRSNQTLRSDGSWTKFFSHEEWANVEITETEGDEKICSALFAFEPRRREKKWRESGQDSDKAKTSNSNSKGRPSGNGNVGRSSEKEGDEEQQCKES